MGGLFGAMNSKLRIGIRKMSFNGDKKLWVQVWPRGQNGFIPSFWDLFRIVRAIIKCERQKYAHLRRDPANLVRRFLAMCCSDMTWEDIRVQCEIPIRDPNQELDLVVDAEIEEQ